MNKTTPVLMFTALLSTSLILAACQKNVHSTNDDQGIAAGIFSNRPQLQDRTLLLIKLNEKPLLSALVDDKGKRKVDADLMKAIAAEQAKLEKDLAALSPDIKVIYRYRMILNGLAVAAPVSLVEKIRGVGNVAYVEGAGNFSRPKLAAKPLAASAPGDFKVSNSVKFIGGEEAHARGVRGQGMKVGIIDTGIDYTHAMFGGAGTEDAYKAVNPDVANAGFPNAKVVGGIDLVGTKYNSASANPAERIPVPDVNPIDEGGHGSHVAGTVAGRGDGVNTYDGVAPDASLYAIKVFGKEGSTGDATVIAALEYAADPNADGDMSDQLDAVNLSLGGEFGDPHLLYTEAIQNLSRGGTFVVASAGNEGDKAYIVGAPSVADDALSVAASVDDMDQNWKFRAVLFKTTDRPEIYTEGIEGTISKPIADAGQVSGTLVYAGIADKDFSDELKAQLKGNVAFIDRGVVTFAEKMKRAFEAGAIGMVVANNQPGEPLAMGGEGNWAIPAIMIPKDLGDQLKAAQLKGAVSIEFSTPKKIEKPNLIDSITGFSSKGPRSLDALLKPEISAPGAQVVSAKMGGGAAGIQMSGTSMAGPHMAGVMALLKQTHPTMTSAQLKSLAMGTAKTIMANGKDVYPLSRQGAGRIQIMKALDAQMISSPVAISLGESSVEARKMMSRKLEITNVSAKDITVSLAFESKNAMKVAGPSSVTLAAGETKTLALNITVDASNVTGSNEFEGLIKFMNGADEVLRVPVLMIVNKISQVKASKLVIHSTSDADSQGAAVDLTLVNKGSMAAKAYAFNLIGRDGRKEDASNDVNRSKACDLASAGYRIVQKDGASMLQFAAKLYEPLTTWDQCEISVLIDADKDGIPDQELVGARQDHVKGLTATTFNSILLDAGKTRGLRKQFELDTIAQKEGAKEDYTEAVLALQPMIAANHSSIAIIEVPVAALKLRSTGELAVRIATSYQEGSAIMPDDFLKKDPKAWTKLSVADQGAAFTDLPESIDVAAGAATTVSFTKGAGSEKLLMLYPTNKPMLGGLSGDQQAELVKASYEVAQ